MFSDTSPCASRDVNHSPYFGLTTLCGHQRLRLHHRLHRNDQESAASLLPPTASPCSCLTAHLAGSTREQPRTSCSGCCRACRAGRAPLGFARVNLQARCPDRSCRDLIAALQKSISISGMRLIPREGSSTQPSLFVYHSLILPALPAMIPLT